MELVTGATGYVGARLIERLRRDEPAGASADAWYRAAAPGPGFEVATGDVISGHGIRAAMEGCDVAYYLVHSMEAAAGADFAARDRPPPATSPTPPARPA